MLKLLATAIYVELQKLVYYRLDKILINVKLRCIIKEVLPIKYWGSEGSLNIVLLGISISEYE